LIRVCIGWNQVSNNRLVIFQEADYPAFPIERQGRVNKCRKDIIDMSRPTAINKSDSITTRMIVIGLAE
jgi:hypothetical protein